MPKYVILVNWTEQGVRNVTETTKRAEQVRQMVDQMGGRMDTLLWTQGRYDLVGVMGRHPTRRRPPPSACASGWEVQYGPRPCGRTTRRRSVAFSPRSAEQPWPPHPLA